MTTAKRKKKKTVSQRLWSLHWWMAGIYVPIFVVGTYMANLDRDVSYRGMLYDFHKSLGVLTMILLTVRSFMLLLKLQRKAPPSRPKQKFDRMRRIALHALLYIFMLGVPLSGWFFSNSFDKDVAFFGIVLPRLFVANQEIAEFGRDMHFWLSYTFLAFIVLHAIDQWKFLRATVRRYYKAVEKKFASS